MFGSCHGQRQRPDSSFKPSRFTVPAGSVPGHHTCCRLVEICFSWTKAWQFSRAEAASWPDMVPATRNSQLAIGHIT